MIREENFTRPWYWYARLLLPVDLQGKSIIDLGGGACEFSRELRERGCQVAFADIEEENVARARKLGFDSYRIDLNEPLAFGDGVFDGAIMLEVIEHVFKAEKLLSEVHRILRPGAFLILSTPNIAHLSRRMKAVRGFPPEGEGYHVRFFTPSLLSSMLAKSGFHVEALHQPSSTFGVNWILKKLGKAPVSFRVPPILRPLLVRTIILRARKV